MVGLHAVNNLLPLTTVPYLVRTLGVETYGKLGFALAVNQYLLLVSEYGFTLSASRDVARHQTDRTRVSELFWNVQFAKLALLVLAFLTLVPLVHFVPSFMGAEPLIYAGFILVVGHFVAPVWLFLGKEAMRPFLLFTVVARLLAIPAIFILVKSPEDGLIAMAFQAAPMFVTGLLTLGYASRTGWLIFVKPRPSMMGQQLRQGWPLFVASVSTSLYTISTPIVLGIFAGPAAVGVFVAADKIRAAALSLITPVSQVMFPRLNVLLEQKQVNVAIQTIRRMLALSASVHAAIAILLVVFAAQISQLAYATSAPQAKDVLVILAPVVCVIGISNVLGTHVTLPLGMSTWFGRVLLMAGIWHIVALVVLAPRWGAIGAAVAILSTELLILAGFIFGLITKPAASAGLHSPTSVLNVILAVRPKPEPIG